MLEEIDKKLLKSWQLKRRYGDVTAISLRYNVSRPVITAALNEGKAKRKVIEFITEFFGERA